MLCLSQAKMKIQLEPFGSCTLSMRSRFSSWSRLGEAFGQAALCLGAHREVVHVLPLVLSYIDDIRSILVREALNAHAK